MYTVLILILPLSSSHRTRSSVSPPVMTGTICHSRCSKVVLQLAVFEIVAQERPREIHARPREKIRALAVTEIHGRAQAHPRAVGELEDKRDQQRRDQKHDDQRNTAIVLQPGSVHCVDLGKFPTSTLAGIRLPLSRRVSEISTAFGYEQESALPHASTQLVPLK